LHEFDFEAVGIYVLRWIIVERWSRYNADQARDRLEPSSLNPTASLGSRGSVRRPAGNSFTDSSASLRGCIVMTSHVQLPEPTAEIIAVQDDLVTLSPLGEAPLIKNEVVYIIPHGPEREGQPREYLKAEVLRVRGKSAEAQVLKVRRRAVGDKVIQSGEMLSVALWRRPLEHGLRRPAEPARGLPPEHGFFLPRGVLDQCA
jgi:hypothetical protein